ncbi:MAG TPA: NAD(P)/FAD-dependent oxidoreductase [Candidatus Binataceae bacterium]|nr:NAD(P)/FAD-dependent oxidoreductase [Candidatus Binataceae bacterium]
MVGILVSRGTDSWPSLWDLIVVGGGPAGLATAIVAAEQGLSVLVLERRKFASEKACGEGLLPPGVKALERLGIRDRFDHTTSRPFRGIRFIQEDGSSVAAPMPWPGLGIRRVVLLQKLIERAEELGAVLWDRCAVLAVAPKSDRAIVTSTGGEFAARLVVAADGLHSSLRKASGLRGPSGPRRRFALRQHYEVEPWTEFVEVYADDKGEAFATPVSDRCVAVNCVWEHGGVDRPTMPTLLSLFPRLAARLGNAPAVSTVLGAGPMAQSAMRRNSDRMVLVGDAAGFIDSIAGEGLSIAFNSTIILGRHLKAILARGATRESLEPFEREWRGLFRGYAFITNAMLAIERRPRTRRMVIRSLMKHPWVFRAIMSGGIRMMATAA